MTRLTSAFCGSVIKIRSQAKTLNCFISAKRRHSLRVSLANLWDQRLGGLVLLAIRSPVLPGRRDRRGRLDLPDLVPRDRGLAQLHLLADSLRQDQPERQ